MTLLIASLAACAVPADEPTGETSSAITLSDVVVVVTGQFPYGGSIDGGTYFDVEGRVCDPGFVRVEPPAVSHTGTGNCNFDGWIDPANPGDCRARIAVLKSDLFRTGTCYFTIYEEPQFVQRTIGITTANGHVWTASTGGGQAGTVTPLSPLRTDSTWLGPQETFGFVWIDAARTKFALRTNNQFHGYVSASFAGGVSGANDGTSPLHTDATWAGPWEQFTIRLDNGAHTATLQTLDGHYVTANWGGSTFGCLGGTCQLRTDAAAPGGWETFGWFAF